MRPHRITPCFVLALFAIACEPGVTRPGAWLSGEEVTTPVADWSFSDQSQDCYLEAATWYGVPHSVTLWCAAHAGDMYVGSFSDDADWEGLRTWENHLARDGEGAIRVAGKIYRGRWQRITDADLTEAVRQSYAAKYGHTETWKAGADEPPPDWRFYRLDQ